MIDQRFNEEKDPNVQVRIAVATTDQHLNGIIALQQKNIIEHLSKEQIAAQGFVTARHSLEILRNMTRYSPQFIALFNDEVVGYVLSMHVDLKDEVEALKPMFKLFDTLIHREKPISAHRIIIAGQTCIDKPFRGTGLLEQLYAKAKGELQDEYEFFVTEIAVNNHRSMRAHSKLGFIVLHTYNDSCLDWNIVAWDWNCNPNINNIIKPLVI